MPSDTRPYTVGSGPVTLKVVIGAGQLGTTGVRLDGNMIPPRGGDTYLLGDGDLLRGKTVEVVSAVNQTNPSTSAMFVTYTLTGGPAPLVLPQEAQAATPGQMVFFEAFFPLE